MTKIAVLGTGHLGSIHTKLWSANKNVQLAAVVEADEARGRAIATEYSTIWYPSVEQLPQVDAVTIATPTSTHAELAIACINRGFHCFIEKPVTATYQEALLVQQAAEAANVVVQVGHVERFNPAVKALQNINVQPLFIEGHRMAQFKPRAIDVSVVHDLMIHDIDLLLWLTKSTVTDIQATGVAVLTETPDICNARITFANGCVANLTASRISNKPMRKLRIFQQAGYISLDFGAPSLEMYRLIDTSTLEPDHQTPLANISTQFGEKVIVYDTPEVVAGNAIAEEQQAFINSIVGNKDAAVTLREGSEAVRIAELIHELIG